MLLMPTARSRALLGVTLVLLALTAAA